jgi:hypothetical protein
MAIDRNARCDRVLIDILGGKMKEINLFAKAYKRMYEVEKEEQNQIKKEELFNRYVCSSEKIEEMIKDAIML